MSSLTIHYQRFRHESDLDPIIQQLLQEARDTCQHAYAPYSGFRVGAAVCLGDGLIVRGVNIENASYPVGICAERAALSSALSGYPGEIIQALAISYLAPDHESIKPVFPCGMCRQFIAEIEEKNGRAITLVLAGKSGDIIVMNQARDLLPFHFSGHDL